MTYATEPRGGFFGTHRAAKMITAIMAIYFVLIGALVFGYVQVSSCLANYANKSAKSTNARAEAAAQDRGLNEREDNLDDQDRRRSRLNDKALAELVAVLRQSPQSQQAITKEFNELVEVNKESSQVFVRSDAERLTIDGERAKIEEARKSNPVPPPPGESC